MTLRSTRTFLAACEGVVRWLRPSFQNPSANPAATQSDLALPEAVATGRKTKVVKLPWPTSTRE